MRGPFFINYLHNLYSTSIEYKITANVLLPKRTYRFSQSCLIPAQ